MFAIGMRVLPPLLSPPTHTAIFKSLLIKKSPLVKIWYTKNISCPYKFMTSTRRETMENTRLLTDLRRAMAYILFAFGVISNSLGMVNSILHHTNLLALIATAASLAIILILFVVSATTRKYNIFIFGSVIITGFVYFPMEFLITSTPSYFFLYMFILPVSYGIGITRKHDFIIPLINCAFIAVLLYLRLSLNTAFIYTIIYVYSFIVTAVFSLNAQKYVSGIQAENREFKKMAERDELTSLYNRYYLQSFVDSEEEWIPIMIDIDFFKSVNDKYGHDEGDSVLQRLSLILLRFSNDNLVMFRFGGEEFLILSKMSESSTDKKAIELMDTIRNELHTSDGKSVTVSIGIGRKAPLSNSAIKIADINLYISKNNGRNCVSKSNQVFYS